MSSRNYYLSNDFSFVLMINAAMPNQRSKDKVHLGGFIEKKLHDEIVRLSKKEGMAANKFGFVQILIREAIDRRNAKTKAGPAKKQPNG